MMPVILLLQSMNVSFVRFERLKNEYPTCPDFGLIFQYVQNGDRHDYVDFVIGDGYLFRGSRLCIP